MFNIWCDEKIPFAKEAFARFGKITYCKGNRLTSAELKEVDVLLIRSTTRVDEKLLAGTKVQFVASATAGTDHVDQDYLKKSGISFYHAPGCNAEAVVEYVLVSLLVLEEKYRTTLQGKQVGIVGFGNVGSRLAPRLEALGLEVIVNDPPLLDSDPQRAVHYRHEAFDALLEQVDILTLHVPLVQGGPYPTHHMLNAETLGRMKPTAWLINACRGAVVCNQDLIRHKKAEKLEAVVLDVWENEPVIDAELLDVIDIGTAHIAGHSYDGKVTGTIMIYDAFVKHFQLEDTWNARAILEPDPALDQLDIELPNHILSQQAAVHDLARKVYDIRQDDHRLRDAVTASDPAEAFRHVRKQYPRRRSFHFYKLSSDTNATAPLRKKLKEGLGLQVA